MPFTVTGTTSSSINTAVNKDLPTGYDASNCSLIGFSIQNKSNSNWYSNPNTVSVYLMSGKAYISVSENAWTSQSYKILICPH